MTLVALHIFITFIALLLKVMLNNIRACVIISLREYIEDDRTKTTFGNSVSIQLHVQRWILQLK